MKIKYTVTQAGFIGIVGTKEVVTTAGMSTLPRKGDELLFDESTSDEEPAVVGRVDRVVRALTREYAEVVVTVDHPGAHVPAVLKRHGFVFREEVRH